MEKWFESKQMIRILTDNFRLSCIYLIIDELDREGIDIALRIKNRLHDVKVEYCSDTLIVNIF